MNRIKSAFQTRFVEPPQSADISTVCNVLLIGETQAGKSTFIEAIKKYNTQDYCIETSRIGTGNVSFTKEVAWTQIDTDLPTYNVIETQKPRGVSIDEYSPQPKSTVINTDALIDDESDWEDYEERINKRKGLRLERVAPHPRTLYRFNLIDTPGLNDTDGEDEVHISTIFRALERQDEIHLVLVMVGPNPFTLGFRTALECYMKVFPEFQGVIAFVHTKFDYTNLHPQRWDSRRKFEEKKNLLHEIMGRSNCQHFVIDCDFESSKLIRTGITLSTIRRILSMAPYNVPITINKKFIHKTPKMMILDKIIFNKYALIKEEIVKTLGTKNKTQGDILNDVYNLKTNLDKLIAEKKNGEDFIVEHDTNVLVMIHESRYDQQWRWLEWNRPQHMSLPSQELTISKVSLLHEATEVVKQKGGEGDTVWEIDFKRKSYENGVLQAKIYTTMADKHRSEISERKTRACCLESEIPEAEEKWNKYNEKHASEQQKINKLVEESRLYTDLLSLAEKDRLDSNVFQQLVGKKAYTGTLDEIVDNVAKMYLEAARGHPDSIKGGNLSRESDLGAKEQ